MNDCNWDNKGECFTVAAINSWFIQGIIDFTVTETFPKKPKKTKLLQCCILGLLPQDNLPYQAHGRKLPSFNFCIHYVIAQFITLLDCSLYSGRL